MSLLSLAAVIELEGSKTVRLMIMRPELHMSVRWTTGPHATSFMATKFLALLDVRVQYDGWHVHAEEQASLPDHVPVSACACASSRRSDANFN